MSTVESQRRLHLEKRAIEALKERIGRDAYLQVKDVQDRLGLSREKVEALPPEILPYVDFGLGERSLKRYHPADVLAVDARMRGWKAAQDSGEGESYLRGLRDELAARDAAAMRVAREMNEALQVA